MASYMSTFRARLRKMTKQGFIIPKYIQNIKSEKTARKYSYEEIAKRSKYREIYKGKERTVSGERGLELRRSESARKAAETRRKRKSPPGYADRSLSEDDYGWDSEDDVQEWDERKEQLRRNIDAILNSFHSEKLANMIRYLFEKREREDGVLFWIHFLDIEDTVISKLQDQATITYNSRDSYRFIYDEWLMLLNYGTIPTLDERQSNAETAEEDEAYEDEEM